MDQIFVYEIYIEIDSKNFPDIVLSLLEMSLKLKL